MGHDPGGRHFTGEPPHQLQNLCRTLFHLWVRTKVLLFHLILQRAHPPPGGHWGTTLLLSLLFHFMPPYRTTQQGPLLFLHHHQYRVKCSDTGRSSSCQILNCFFFPILVFLVPSHFLTFLSTSIFSSLSLTTLGSTTSSNKALGV